MSTPVTQTLDYGATAKLTTCGEASAKSRSPGKTATVTERFEGITAVRMVAAFFVVVNHTTYRGLESAPSQVSEAIRTLNNIGWMVPFFMLLSGFLFARSAQDKSDTKISSQCGKSARRALTLWLTWSALYLLNGPLNALMHGDLQTVLHYYQSMLSYRWPSVLWTGPSYHLWYLASLLMAWLLLGLVLNAMPGCLRPLLKDRSATPLLWTAGLAAAAGFAASQLEPVPASAAGQVLEVLVVHAVLPLTFVLMGAALWHHRYWLTQPAVITCLFCMGGILIWAEMASGLGLHGPGPRSLSMGGLVLATAALSLGLQLPIKQPLAEAWNVSAGVYCVHMIAVSRLGKFFAGMEHGSASLLLAVAAFTVSILVSLVLGRFSPTSRLVK